MHLRSHKALALPVFLFAALLHSEVRVQILPDENVPNRVVLENDGLRVGVSVSRAVHFTSFLDKATGVDFIDPARPAPVVNISNNWHLLQLGFNIWQIHRIETGAGKGVEIELFSNYLENPHHLFLRLTLPEQPQLNLDLWVENRAQAGLHDIRYVSRQQLAAGLTFLHFMQANNAGKRYIIFKQGHLAFHTDTADVGMYFLRQPDAPAFPLVVSFPKMRAGLLLHKEATDLEWSFQSASEALAFMRPAPVAPGRAFKIFQGTLKPFPGDWHAAFRWWKDWLRSRLDLSLYRRPGHQEYRRKILGNFTMVFDNDFYEPVKNRYRLEEFLERGRREFGGYDFLIFWHAYPRIGVDGRDQWDMYQGLPGGAEGVRRLVAEANTLHVWVMLSLNPWDVIGKRKDPVETQAEIMAATRANGTYLDILGGADREFRRKFDRVNPDIVFSSESRPAFKGLEVSTGSQEDHSYVNEMPRLDLLRFVLPEHNIQNTERNSRNRIAMIRNSLFNFTGLTVWEDIFGEINRFSSPERVLITRFNRLAHDYLDAFLDEHPEPLIPTRSFPPLLGSSPFETYSLPPAVRDEALTREHASSARLYVNRFFGTNKVLYSLYDRDGNKTDRYHDNRVIGKLFLVDFPKDWHLVNVWDVLPARVVEDEDGRWAFTDTELSDASCVFAAMPERIRVLREGDRWRVTVDRPFDGLLRLVGVDVTGRPISHPAIPAASGLSFRAGDVEPNVQGYVMVQFLIDEVVQDVAVVRVNP